MLFDKKCIAKLVLFKGEYLITLAKHDSLSTSHSAYVATETELHGAKIDGLLPPNFL